MKYPNAKISTNNNGKLYYIHLYSLNNKLHNIYLTNTGEELDWQTSELSVLEKEKLVFFKTKELAEQTLNKYNNMENKPITLTEIKSQLAEAKKLIGKTVKQKDSTGKVHRGEVISVELYVNDYREGGEMHNKFFKENGYVISLKLIKCLNHSAFVYPYVEVVEDVKVILNSSYTAILSDSGIRVGCQTFSLDIVDKLVEARKQLA